MPDVNSTSQAEFSLLFCAGSRTSSPSTPFGVKRHRGVPHVLSLRVLKTLPSWQGVCSECVQSIVLHRWSVHTVASSIRVKLACVRAPFTAVLLVVAQWSIEQWLCC